MCLMCFRCLIFTLLGRVELLFLLCFIASCTGVVTVLVNYLLNTFASSSSLLFSTPHPLEGLDILTDGFSFHSASSLPTST